MKANTKKRIENPLVIDFRSRLSLLKETVKEKGASFPYLDLAAQAFPDLNTIKGGHHIQNVWKCNAVNFELLTFWEKAAGIEPLVEAGS